MSNETLTPVASPVVDKPRNLVAVTVIISEPADTAPIDWPFLVSALIRSHFNGYPDTVGTVQVIDAWRADQ